MRESLAGASAVAQQLGGDAGQQLLSTAQHSFVNGFTGTLLIAVAVAAIGAVVSWFVLPRARVVEEGGAPDAAVAAQPGEADARTGS